MWAMKQQVLSKSGGLTPPLQNSGGVATPPPPTLPPLFGALGSIDDPQESA